MRWGRIDRDIEAHWAYEPDREFTKREALIWLYLHVRYDDGFETLRGAKVYVKRGQLVTSIRHLRRTWNWRTERRVIRFLENLRESGDLLFEKSPLGILITLLKRADRRTIGEVLDRISRDGDTNLLWMQTRPAKVAEDRQFSDIPIPTEEEKELLRVLQGIPGYPADDAKDLQVIRDVREEFPELDVAASLKEYAKIKRYSPLGKNPRLEFYNLCRALEEGRGKRAKRGRTDGKAGKAQGKGEEQDPFDSIAHLFR